MVQQASLAKLGLPVSDSSVPAHGTSRMLPSEATPNGFDQSLYFMQGSLGNQAANMALAEQTTGASKKPLEFMSAGIGFRLPGDTDLTNDWNQVETDDPTWVQATVTEHGLQVSFSPALVIDVQWPMSNCNWSGFTYDFARGAITSVELENSQTVAIASSPQVRPVIEQNIMGFIRGTPLAKPGYNPMQDPKLADTLKALQASFAGQAKKPSNGFNPVTPSDYSLSGTARANEKIESGSGDGSITLGAGATIGVTARLGNTMPKLDGSEMPDVQQVDITSSDLVVSHNGKPAARLKAVTIKKGGAVDVTSWEPLGPTLKTIRTAGTLESLLKAIIVISAARNNPYYNGSGNIEPTETNALVEKELEVALTGAVKEFVQANWDAVPGIDLRAILGIPAAPPAIDTHPKKSTPKKTS